MSAGDYVMDGRAQHLSSNGFWISLTAVFTNTASFSYRFGRPFAANCIGYPVITFVKNVAVQIR